MKKQGVSLKYRILLAILLLLLPVAAAFGVFNGRAITQINDQLATANRSALGVFCTSVEGQMQRAQGFLNLIWVDDKSFHRFGMVSDYAQARDSGLAVSAAFPALLDANSEISSMLLYHPPSGVYVAEFGKQTNYGGAQKDQIRAMVERVFTAGQSQTLGWFIEFAGEKPFWVFAMRSGEGYSVCLIDLEQLSKRAQSQYALSSPIVFLKNGRPLTTAVWVRDNGGDVGQVGSKSYYFAGSNRRYIVVRDSTVGLEALYAVPYRANMGSLGWLSTGPLLFLGAAAFALIAVWLYLKRSFFRPLNNLVVTMERIEAGDLTARSGDFRSREFSLVNKTFNSMIGEITTLRIESYESQLAAERAQMEALRMQIRPHFFLNCMKNLYGLAQAGRTEDIQAVILLLSAHLRYTFTLDADVAPLEKELAMCENYIGLQGVGQLRKPECRLTVDPGLLALPVPPVSLLTLIENSVKHGAAQEHALIVEITARTLRMDDRLLADVVLRDNGPGFAPDMLAALNHGVETAEPNSHVGLVNIVRRFRILYGDAFAITFANRGGAQVELFIPIKGQEEL